MNFADIKCAYGNCRLIYLSVRVKRLKNLNYVTSDVCNKKNFSPCVRKTLTFGYRRMKKTPSSIPESVIVDIFQKIPF